MKSKKKTMLSFSNRNICDHSLIFFPFAGGSGELFIPWFQHFPNNISCRYAMLKGRGKYFQENAFDNIHDLVDDILPEILKVCDRPFSLFGHSMGAIIAFEITRALHEKFDIVPNNLFISGFRAPRLIHNREFLHTMSPEKLLERLRDIGSSNFPDKMTVDDIRPFLPTLYRDFKLCELYSYKQCSPIPCHMTIFWGEDDDLIQNEKISLWEKESSYPVEFKKFSGGHFFIWEHSQKLISIINDKIQENKCIVRN